MILTVEYFQESYFVPNLMGNAQENANIQRKLLMLVSKYEVVFLRKLLGAAFADTAYAEMIKTAPDAKWTALKNKIYVVPTSPGTLYASPVAGYVYNFWLKSQLSVTTGSGELKAKPDGTESTSNWQKVISNWNDMVDQILELRQWMDDNASTYPTYVAGDTGWQEFELINQWGI